jgi:hypothetical protein
MQPWLVGIGGLVSLKKVCSALLNMVSLQDPIPCWCLCMSYGIGLVCCVMRWLQVVLTSKEFDLAESFPLGCPTKKGLASCVPNSRDSLVFRFTNSTPPHRHSTLPSLALQLLRAAGRPGHIWFCLSIAVLSLVCTDS